MENWNNSVPKAAFDRGFVGIKSQVIVGIDSIGKSDIIAAGEITSDFLGLACSIPHRLYRGDFKKIGEQCGYSTTKLNKLTAFTEFEYDQVFARSDMVLHKGKWKILELNIGSFVGGMQSASLPRIAGINQNFDVLEAWSLRLANHFQIRDKNIAFVGESSEIEKYSKPLSIYTEQLQHHVNTEVLLIGASELEWTGSQLLCRGRAIDIVYCLFDINTLERHAKEFHPLMSAVSFGAVKCPMSPLYKSVANKGMLALLWKLRDGRILTEKECELIENHIPHTYWVERSNAAALVSQQERLVLKPVDGHCGEDVVCGRELTRSDWLKAIDDACNRSPRQFVAQLYIESDPIMVRSVDVNMRLTNELSRVVWGTFVFGQEFLGMYLRSRSCGETAVINAGTGAGTGPLPTDVLLAGLE
ncbi:hypothetical protein [Burkholderia glumae]|uniref:hypothetical protein n=1 Tax=Burkholderia glumae TaxID=337 RepID=UPI0012FB41B8|nr:hypothetical protein [Burkholderia glumae]